MDRALILCLLVFGFFSLACSTRVYAPPPPVSAGVAVRPEEPSIGILGDVGAGDEQAAAMLQLDGGLPVATGLQLRLGAGPVITYDEAFWMGSAGVRRDALLGGSGGQDMRLGVGVGLVGGVSGDVTVYGAYGEAGIAGVGRKAQPFVDARVSGIQRGDLPAGRVELLGGVDVGGPRASFQAYGGLEVFHGLVDTTDHNWFSSAPSRTIRRTETFLQPRVGLRMRFGLGQRDVSQPVPTPGEEAEVR